MKLLSTIESYVALKRALGAVFSVDARILRSFGRTLGDISVDAVTSEGCREFCRGNGVPTRFWERKHESLRGFFRYLVAREHLVRSRYRNLLHESTALSVPTSTRTTSSEGCWRPPLEKGAVAPLLNLRPFGP